MRFSKDKLPYKTNLGLLFWEGDDKKLESSGFYFHIEPKYFFIGGGTYLFSDNMIKAYREALSDKTAREQIASAIKKMKKLGYQIEFNPYNGVTVEMCHVYIARELYPVAGTPDETEEFELFPLTADEIDERIRNGVIWDGMSIAAWTIVKSKVTVDHPGSAGGAV